MSTTPWDEMTRGWTEMYDRQTELAKEWFQGQTQLTDTLTEVAEKTNPYTVFGEGLDGVNPLADAGAMAELWRSWTALGGSLGRTLPGVSAGGGIAAETLGRITDPLAMSLAGGGQVGDTIRRMTEGPRFADIGAAEHRMSKLFGLWMSVQTAARDYERIVAGAWMKANQEFARDVASRSRTETEVRGSKQALRLWLEIADRTLVETHRTPEFLQAQQKLLAQGMDFLLAEREFVEALVEPAGLPTRTEIDEIHQTVQDLKRRVRQLEKTATRSNARESEKPPAKSSVRAPRKSKAAATHTAPAEQGVDA
jgi:polyhydroxyalkanoate synthase subunit PhaE